MRQPRSVTFDVGLAAGGCPLIYPVVPWVWPFGDPFVWDGWPLLAGSFAASYAAVRLVGLLVREVESACTS